MLKSRRNQYGGQEQYNHHRQAPSFSASENEVSGCKCNSHFPDRARITIPGIWTSRSIAMSIAGFFFIFVAGCYWPSVASYSAEALADQVVTLPGAHSSQKSKQFSGYLDVSATRGIHYMYFESERNPEKDSVVFWTNGGPGELATFSRALRKLAGDQGVLLLLGCSGLLGLYTEFGPWRAGANTTLIRNPFSWTKYANIVFLEQPVGVGFSYSTTPIASTGTTLLFCGIFSFPLGMLTLMTVFSWCFGLIIRIQ